MLKMSCFMRASHLFNLLTDMMGFVPIFRSEKLIFNYRMKE